MKKNSLVITASTILMLLLGVVYSYSIFRLEIEEVFSVSHVAGGIPYMLVLFFYALFMMIGGILYTRYNTFKVALSGIFLIVVGFYLSSLSNSIVALSVSYGVLVGSGIGIVYLLPLRVISQLNSNNLGLLTGISLSGFGLSPLLFARPISYSIETFNLSNTLLYLSIIFLFTIPPLVYFLVKQDYKEKIIEPLHYDVLRKKDFYILYVLFFIGAFVGLTFIGLTTTLGKELHHFTIEEMAIYLGVFAVFNGIGRPLFGFINDKIGFKKSALLSFSLILIAAVLQFFIDLRFLFIIGFIVFYLNFGGWLSLAPAATRNLFGSKKYSKNYGLLFTAYGVAAILGTISSGYLAEHVSYHAIFIMMSVLVVLGMIVVFRFEPSKKD